MRYFYLIHSCVCVIHYPSLSNPRIEHFPSILVSIFDQFRSIWFNQDFIVKGLRPLIFSEKWLRPLFCRKKISLPPFFENKSSAHCRWFRPEYLHILTCPLLIHFLLTKHTYLAGKFISYLYLFDHLHPLCVELIKFLYKNK